MDKTNKNENDLNQKNLFGSIDIPLLLPMDTAPKDGTRIIIVWYDESMDCINYNIREAWWWKPTNIGQWESGARPHWEYISDRDSCHTIINPNGWMPKPKLLDV